MDYKLKYQIYKTKYLKLKNNQSGGSLNKPELYLFKAEWCGHCQNFKPEWEKLKNNDNLKKKINFVTMDSDVNNTEIENWNIKGFPTIIFKHNNKKIEYKGIRSVDEIEKFIHNNINP